MTEPSRWTVYRYGDFDWHLGAAPGAEIVEVMPVSEHEAVVADLEAKLRAARQMGAGLVAAVNVSESEKVVAARLVVDAEYRREQWGSDTVATFDRAIQALRESLR